MDTILQSFNLSYVLRSTLSGAFFVLTVWYSSQSVPAPVTTDSIALVIGMSVLAGTAIYSCHRAMVYPVIEWFTNTNWAKERRKTCPLLSNHSFDMMMARWRWECGNTDLQKTVFSHTSVWADYTQFLYASGLAVILGWVTGMLISGKYVEFGMQALLALFFFFTAFISDWRFNSLHDRLLKTEEFSFGKDLNNKEPK